MKRFYIMFGRGYIFADYYLCVMATSEQKVRAFCDAHVPGWAAVLDEARWPSYKAKYDRGDWKPLKIESAYFLHPDLCSPHGELAVPK